MTSAYMAGDKNESSKHEYYVTAYADDPTEGMVRTEKIHELLPNIRDE